MSDADVLLEQARNALQRVSGAVEKPSADSLEEALKLLHEIREQFRRLPAEARGRSSLAAELSRSLAEARLLAGQAGAYYLGLASVVLSSAGSYTAAGEAAPPSGCRQVSVEG